MNHFDTLVGQQLETMDQLLFLQSEIERCQEIEQELEKLQEKTKLNFLREEILSMKLQLKEIQQTFETQTAEIIRTYQATVS
ncbi:YgaB family protein [Bacillus songklensis]|uniref:YgaB family protein n=1 Tax=Bacillus songklensis TaxID=1069116 RepID=A0ABV8B741_9BACI